MSSENTRHCSLSFILFVTEASGSAGFGRLRTGGRDLVIELVVGHGVVAIDRGYPCKLAAYFFDCLDASDDVMRFVSS